MAIWSPDSATHCKPSTSMNSTRRWPGPGEADLTSHVDFQVLAEAASAAGAHVHRPLTQGDFLLGLGLIERAGALGAGRDSLTQATIGDAVNRLAGEGEGRMGALFKVLAVSGRKVRIAPFDPQQA
jgi:SAM-dependent MidA family methyltransferase